MLSIGGVTTVTGGAQVIDVEGLGRLIEVLAGRGYQTLGPVVRDGGIAAGPVSTPADLPAGWHDQQEPGRYRLRPSDDPELFGWAVGPQSWKPQLFPPTEVLWRATVDSAGVQVEEPPRERPPIAVIGARPCEIAAVSVLDKVLAGGAHPDPRYSGRRADAFVVVVECGSPSGTCFCTSMGTGPGVDEDFDLALTELGGGDTIDHRFVVRAGSPAGASVLEEIPHRAAGPGDLDQRAGVLDGARARMGRVLDTDGLPDLLSGNIDHPRWSEVAERCLACGNCTMVCPTCFCTDVEDVTDLGGAVERRRRWASCFDLDHSLLHGGAVRSTVSSRYRQWATHKLSTWHDQFGTSGCVGCGRCITWCPVGIDLTEEVAAIRASDRRGNPTTGEAR